MEKCAGYDSWQQPSPLSCRPFDAVAESGFREVLKSLFSNIWLHYVSIETLRVPLNSSKRL